MNYQIKKTEKKSPPFTQIPDHWEPLIGYEYRKINRNGTLALDTNSKPKIGRIDLYDLMILDAMRSYKERAGGKCFIESEQLAIKIGLRNASLKQVCDRVLQLMHLGFLKCEFELYGANNAERLVWEVDTQLVEDVAQAIAEERREAKLRGLKNGDFPATSKKNVTLKEYIKEYLSEYRKEQLTEDREENLSEQLPEKGEEKLTKYVKKHIPEDTTDHGTEQVPEEVAEQSALTPVDADCDDADDIHISDFPVPESVQSDNDGQEATASPMGSDNNMPTVPAYTQDTPTPEAMQRYIIDYLIGLDPDNRLEVNMRVTRLMGKDTAEALRCAKRGDTAPLQRGYEYIMQLSTEPPAEANTEPKAEEQEAPTPSMSNEDNWQLPEIIAEIDRIAKDLPNKGIPKTAIAEAIKGATGGYANYNIIPADDIAWMVLAELRQLDE